MQTIKWRIELINSFPMYYCIGFASMSIAIFWVILFRINRIVSRRAADFYSFDVCRCLIQVAKTKEELESLDEKEHEFFEFLKYESLDCGREFTQEQAIRRYNTRNSSTSISKSQKKYSIILEEKRKPAITKKNRVSIKLDWGKYYAALSLLLVAAGGLSSIRYFFMKEKTGSIIFLADYLASFSQVVGTMGSLTGTLVELFIWPDNRLPQVRFNSIYDYMESSIQDFKISLYPKFKLYADSQILIEQQDLLASLETSIPMILNKTVENSIPYKNHEIAMAGIAQETVLLFIQKYINLCEKLMIDRKFTKSEVQRADTVRNDQFSSLLAYFIYNKLGLVNGLYYHMLYPILSRLLNQTTKVSSSILSANILTGFLTLSIIGYFFFYLQVRKFKRTLVSVHRVLICIPLTLIETNGLLKHALKKAALLNNFSYFS